MKLLAQSHCNLGSMFTICFFLMLLFNLNHCTSLHADYIYYSSLIIYGLCLRMFMYRPMIFPLLFYTDTVGFPVFDNWMLFLLLLLRVL